MKKPFEDIHDNIIRNPSGKSYTEWERSEIRKRLDERNQKKQADAISSMKAGKRQ